MGRSQLPSAAILLLTNWDIETPSNLQLVTSPALESRKRWSLWHNVPPESVWLQDTCQDPKHTPLVQTYPCFIQGRVPGTPISCLDLMHLITAAALLGASCGTELFLCVWMSWRVHLSSEQGSPRHCFSHFINFMMKFSLPNSVWRCPWTPPEAFQVRWAAMGE